MPIFSIDFDGADYLAFDRHYVLRTSTDGWLTDLAPSDDSGPRWTLDHARYASGFECKFLLIPADLDPPRDVWMSGDNLHLTPAGAVASVEPRRRGSAGPRKLGRCVDLEQLVHPLTGRRLLGSGSRRR